MSGILLAVSSTPGGGGSPGPTLQVFVSPLRAMGRDNHIGTIQSNSVAANASGGVAPYTYSWTYVSGDTDIEATNPTQASTAFYAYMTNFDTVIFGTWKCTVTDAASNTADVDVDITLSVRGFEQQDEVFA